MEECGITDNAVRKVLKKRYKMQPVIFGRSFRTPLAALFLDPTCSIAECGAEISHPFGISAQYQSIIYQSNVVGLRGNKKTAYDTSVYFAAGQGN
ncbi:hypothetical protein Barb7_02573 [Bacteroidales bacterium Barb7]|nr:hypothetical protein Barb7_02573 [Bacteroidales bacterium Barb7]